MSPESNLLSSIESVRQINAAIHLYVIADPAQEIKLRTDYLTQEQYNKQGSLLDPAGTSDKAVDVAPFLVQVPLPHVDPNLWGNIISFGQHVPAAMTVLASSQPFAVMHKHLSYFTEVALPDSSEMILAYWDPAILGTLLGNQTDTTLYVPGPVFTEKQQSAFMSPITAWWYWDRNGQLQCISSVNAYTKQGKLDNADPVKLEQVQVDMLTAASVPDHVLAYLADAQPAALERIAPKQRYTAVRDLLKDANTLRLHTMQDQVRFVGVGLLYGSQMKSDTEIQMLLEKVQQGALKLDAALQQFPAIAKGQS